MQPPELVLSTNSIEYNQNQEIIFTINNTGQNTIVFFKGFSEIALANDPSWEEIFNMHYSEFKDNCDKVHSEGCALIHVEPGESYNLSFVSPDVVGDYSIMIKINEQMFQSNPFTVKPDPKVTLTTTKEVYAIRETIEATFNSETEVNLEIYSKPTLLFLDNDSWKPLAYYCTSASPCFENLTSCGLVPPSPNYVPICLNQTYAKEMQMDWPNKWNWKQTNCSNKEITCMPIPESGETAETIQWQCCECQDALLGTYKIVFQYTLDCPGEIFGKGTEIKTAETEFEIIST